MWGEPGCALWLSNGLSSESQSAQPGSPVSESQKAQGQKHGNHSSLPGLPDAHQSKRTLHKHTQTMYLRYTSAVLLLPFRSHASEFFCLVLQAVHQSSAVLGLGLIGMAEDLGSAMAHRALEHLLQYGDTAVRSAVITVSASAAANCSAKVYNFWMKHKLCPNVTAISMRILAGWEEAVFVLDPHTCIRALCTEVCSTKMHS